MPESFNFNCEKFDAPFSNQVISTQNLWENSTKSAWKEKNKIYTSNKNVTVLRIIMCIT